MDGARAHFAAGIAALCLAVSAQGAPRAGAQNAPKTIRINGVSYDAASAAQAAPSFDKSLRLKKLLLFPSVDDVSGTLAPQLDEDVASILLAYSRFELVRDAKVIRALSPDDAGYPKVSLSDAVHKEAAAAVGSDGTVILRTRTGAGHLEMALEWRDAEGAMLFQEQARVPAFASQEVRLKQLRALVDAVVKKIPFHGTVTGRTGAVITIDLGRKHVKPGDRITLARITGLQRHPLLKTVVQADYVKTGSALITSSDRVMAFAKVEEERPGEAVAADQKIVTIEEGASTGESVQPRQERDRSADDEKFRIRRRDEEKEDRLAGALDRPFPQYGFAAADLGYGSLTHEQTVGGSTTSVSGNGLAAALAGEIWITRNWAAGGGYSFHGATLTGTGGGAGIEAGSSTWKKIFLYGGYRLFPAGADGLNVLFAGGYGSVSMEIPASSANSLGTKDYGGLLFRIGVDVPMGAGNKIAADMDFMPFGSVTDKTVSLGTSSGANMIGVAAGWQKELFPNLWGKLGLKYEQASASYTGGSTASAKHFVFGPGVLYYF